ncbi:MAG: glycosyltransferase [Candidatus Melainabacteria bacterium]|nr:glycosyltransferase [Candidatus Melainabacteria bacterium]
MQLLSILMPVYNERVTLDTIVKRVLAIKIPIDLELVIVDDGSTDGSREIITALAAQDARIKVHFQPKNAGKGAAIRTAIEKMQGDIAIIQDADLEYDPSEIGRLLEPILAGKADAVFGSRFAGSESRRVLYYWHSMGNQVLTWITNVLCDLNFTDMETCYKAVRSDILKQTILKRNDFGLEPELAIRLSQWGMRIYEVPISYQGRTYQEGKKITWKDGVKAIYVILLISMVDKHFTTHDGYYVLRAMDKSRAFCAWMFDQIKEYIGNSVLETGCGIGTLTSYMLGKERLVCSDIDPFFQEIVNRKYGHLKGVSVSHVNLSSKADYNSSGVPFDTVICMNVFEHLENDQAALECVYEALEPGGKAIILVPQHPSLFSKLDTSVGHFRRYTLAELSEKVRQAGFEITVTRQFNRFAALGWFISGKLLGATRVDPGQIKLMNALMPIAKLVEHLPFWPALTIIMIAQKPSPQATQK